MKKNLSQAKIDSNRANAKKSTGPKTERGKAKSKTNALKHGIYSVTTVIKGEDEKLFNSIKSEQQKRFKPKTYIEEALVNQLIAELWTLRKIMRAEYWFTLDVQNRMRTDGHGIFNVPLSKRERKLIDLGNKSPDILGADLEKAADIQESGREPSELSESEKKSLSIFKVHRQVQEKVDRIPDVYLDLFLYSSQDRMQKLIWLRRHSLQTILSLERELGMRVKLRAKSKEQKSKN